MSNNPGRDGLIREADELEARLAAIREELAASDPAKVIAEFLYDANCEAAALRNGKPVVMTQPREVWDNSVGRMVVRNLPTSDNAARGARANAMILAMREIQALPADDPQTLVRINDLRREHSIRAWDPDNSKRPKEMPK